MTTTPPGNLPPELGIVVLVERSGGWMNYISQPAWYTERLSILMEAEGLAHASMMA